MWSYVTTMYFINPLPRYVESIAGGPTRLKVKQIARELVPFDDLAGA